MANEPPEIKAAATAAPLRTQHVVPLTDDDNNILLVKTRQLCLSLAHSASKGVNEIIADAAIYTDWVLTGERPKQEIPETSDKA